MTRWHATVCVLAVLLPATLAGMYGKHVEELTASNFEQLVIKSAETWIVKFYAPWCGHCRNSAPAFTKAAKRLHGVARVGVVDCDTHKGIAQKYGIEGFPTIKTFSGEGKRARRPADYSGQRTAGAISKHARYIQPSFVATVMPKGVDAFFGDLKQLPHVLLFTDKSVTSGLYKGMSGRFRKSIAFGEARLKDGKQVAEKYEVESFPTILTFAPGASDKGVKYEGGMDADSLIEYFEAVQKEGADADPGAAEEGEKKPTFAQPKAYGGEVELIGSAVDYEGKCGQRADGRLCVLALLPGGATHKLMNGLGETAKQYLYDNLAFGVIDTDVEGGKLFGKMFQDAPVVAVRAKKKKYSVLRSSLDELSIEHVVAFVDRVVGGEVRYSKHGDMPQWEAKRKVEDEQAKKKNATTQESQEAQCGVEAPADGGSCGAGGASADAASAKSEL